MRLLLVSSDNGRRNFGVKIKILSNIYLKLAHLKDAPMTNEAARTLKYFAGDLEARDRCVGGDFGGNLSDVLKSRLNIERGSLTLGEVHAFLDGVALRLRAVAQAVFPLALPNAVIVASGGALEDNPLWRQILADALGRPLVMEEASSDATAKGQCTSRLGNT